MCNAAAFVQVAAQVAIAQMQAEQQKGIANANAEMAKQQGDDAVRRGEIDTARKMNQIRLFKSEQRQSLAGHGIDLSQGSALDLQAGTDVMGTQDVQTTMHNAAMEAWGYKSQEAIYRAQASNAQTEAYGKMLKGVVSSATSSYNMNDFFSNGGGNGSMFGSSAASFLGDGKKSGYMNINGSYKQGW